MIGSIYPQINLNQFFFYDKIQSTAGNYQVSFIDFDKDDDHDIIFYGNEKEFIIHTNEDGNFTDAIEKFFFYEISNMELLKSVENYGNIVLFHSRKNMISGLASFTKYGTLQLLNTHQYDGYPDKITIGDINNDNINEALVYGNSFNGISLIEEVDFTIKETKIVDGNIYDFGHLIDINFDEFNDLAILDILDNSIKIFNNDENSQLIEERTYKPNFEINEFHILNFNNDDFEDFLISSNDQIEILIGDSVYSFSEKFVIGIENTSQISVNDFNNDGLEDISWLDEKGDLYFAFSKKYSFSDPIRYLREQKLSHLNTLTNELIKYSVSAKEDGSINIFSNFTDGNESFKVTFDEPITNFIIDKNNLALITNPQSSLITIKNNNKIFTELLNFEFENEFSSLVFNSIKNEYLLFNKDKRFISTINFENGTPIEQNYFFENNIITIQAIDSNYVVLSSLNDSTFVNTINNWDNWETANFYWLSSDSILIETIKIINNEIYFWTLKNDSMYLNSFNLATKLSSQTELLDFKYAINNFNRIVTQNYDSKLITFFEIGDSLVAFINNDRLERYQIVDELKGEKSVSQGNFIYHNDVFFTYEIDQEGKKIYTRKFIESQNVNSYFVTSFYEETNFLVYLNNFDNTINFVRIE